MAKEISMNKKAAITDQREQLISQMEEKKRRFVGPKSNFEQSINNDIDYLLTLQEYINLGREEIAKANKRGDKFAVAKLNVEMFDAIAKFQANEGILHDKKIHYEKVFLPQYEKELSEFEKNAEQFAAEFGDYLDSKPLERKMPDEAYKLTEALISEYDKAMEEQELYKNDTEYTLHVYKTLKRIWTKLQSVLEAQS
jgi:hypothetical protein